VGDLLNGYKKLAAQNEERQGFDTAGNIEKAGYQPTVLLPD